MKILVSIPDELLKKIDVWCKENYSNRSHFLRLAARSILGRASSTTPELDVVQEEPPVKPPNIPIIKKEPQVITPEILKPSVLEVFPCGYKFCKNLSMGKFKVRISDIDSKEMYLCKFHLTLAKRESEVMEIAT